MGKIELLSPAGDYNCFKAAINAGADAVYLSGEKFGARAYAKNFSTEEVISAIDYAHLFNRKVFLTVNTLLKDDEMLELYEYLLPFYRAGLDGVIVQDMGVIAYIRKHFSDLPVHASTQLAITGIEGIKLLEDLGIKRTVLARELSLNEIKDIRNKSDMELETFVHGALCYSYSGKCLFSSLVGGRSGNRGRCAGSCRQPYNDKYVLSTKDICCLSIIPELIDSGIASLKIEGRMKSPEYVAGVTSMYRKYIDIYYSNINKLSMKELKDQFFKGKQFTKDLNILTSLYTRGGNSEGYYFRHNGKNMITIEDASYKSDKGEIKESVNESYIGDILKIELTGYVRIYPEENISILINNEFYYEGGLASYAENRPIDKDTVKKQLSKTKDTEFMFKDFDFDIANNAFVRVSELNELRREALLGYKEYLLSKYRRVEQPESCKITSLENKIRTRSKKLNINCEVLTVEQLLKLINIDGIDGVYVPYNIFIKNNDVIELIRNSHKMVYIKFQSVIRNNFLEKNKEQILATLDKADGVLVDSHEVLDFLKTNNFSKEIVGDIHLYVLNNNAYDSYKELGITKTTVPVELNKKELYKRGIIGEELICYGYLPMMISAQCVNNTINGCDKKAKEISLIDRKGASFKAINSCFDCSNIVYNSNPISLQGEADFINRIEPSSIRIILTTEDSNNISDICNYFISYTNNGIFPKNDLLKQNCFTKGHLNRGVM